MTLKDYVSERGWSLRTLADKLDISKSYASALVNGDKVCSLEVAVRIEDLTRNRVKCRDLLEAAA